MKKIFPVLLILVILLIYLTFNSGNPNDVVIYVAHDQDYSEPVLKKFEAETNIRAIPLYDTEATKTVGLVNRLLAEKNNPNADVFWNNEPMRTIVLKNEGILEPYCSPNGNDIPQNYKNDECYWTGFAARARVLIINTNKVDLSEEPDSIFDLTKPEWKGKVCIANPLLGSTSTHVASLFAALGEEKAKNYFNGLKKNEIQLVESNSMVRDQVVVGECWIGLTDTDDAFDAINTGKPVKMIFPDQEEDSIGTLVFPNTAMLIKNGPNTENGKRLIDYLLSKKVATELAKSALQIPLNIGSKMPNGIPTDLKDINATFEEIFNSLKTSNEFIQKEFII